MEIMTPPLPTADNIEALARTAIAGLPPAFRDPLREVVLKVEEFAAPEVLDGLGIASPYGLLGLYSGISINHKSVWQTPRSPDMILLYRRPILDFWARGSESLARIIRHVVIHEAGHHFGFSDADMAAIERDGG